MLLVGLLRSRQPAKKFGNGEEEMKRTGSSSFAFSARIGKRGGWRGLGLDGDFEKRWETKKPEGAALVSPARAGGGGGGAGGGGKGCCWSQARFLGLGRADFQPLRVTRL